MVVAVRVQIVSPSKRGRMLLVMEPRLNEDFFLVDVWNGLVDALDPVVLPPLLL